MHSTQKPFSALWCVTRSTVPARTLRSVSVLDGGAAMGQTTGNVCDCASARGY